jgi:hypothetical protein
MLPYPGIYGWIAPNRVRKVEELAHRLTGKN